MSRHKYVRFMPALRAARLTFPSAHSNSLQMYARSTLAIARFFTSEKDSSMLIVGSPDCGTLFDEHWL